MDVTVLVATFGDPAWINLAEQRAIPSAREQAPTIHVHGENIAASRNAALARAETEWVIHLDADDELAPGYVEAMSRGTADVRGPVACYVHDNGTERLWRPVVWGHRHECRAECLPEGNWLLVGSAVRRELLVEAGGWHDYPWSEDWSTWIRCWKAGATFELIRDAFYRAHVRPDSRNRGATQEARNEAHWMIHRAEFPELYA